MAKISIDVDPGSTARAYQVRIAHEVAHIKNGHGVMDVEPGDHIMSWDLFGVPGNVLSYVVTQDDKVLATVKDSTIPAGEQLGYGVKPLTVLP